MNHKRKTSAIAKFSAAEYKNLTDEELANEIKGDEKNYTDEEVAEIMADLGKESADAEEEQEYFGNKPFEYPVYDKWKVNVEGLPLPDNAPRGTKKEFKLTAIKLERKGVKIEGHVAESLNAQSHNNRIRYYLAGSITNGHEETVKPD